VGGNTKVPGLLPNDDLGWMAGRKQELIKEWLNAK